jgi:hypothetical protein
LEWRSEEFYIAERERERGGKGERREKGKEGGRGRENEGLTFLLIQSTVTLSAAEHQ